MNIATTIAEIRHIIKEQRSKGNTVGFVPTMGYLHEGHAALVDAARKDNDFVVASSFVNPLQFGPSEDFDAYPRNQSRDEALLSSHGCDLLFAPGVNEMYPVAMATQVELPELGKVLCGKSRPTHFRGVTTVVCKLFNIVQPDKAYFGQKDGQQAAIIRRMVTDLNLPVEIVTVATIREPDGLAKSSRNIYLNDQQRQHAIVLYRALSQAKQLLVQGERSGPEVAQFMADLISREPGVTLDYADIVELGTLAPALELEGKVMLAVAAYVGKARLIDNLQLLVTPTSVIDLHDSNVPVR